MCRLLAEEAVVNHLKERYICWGCDVLSNYGLQLHHVVKFTVYLKNIEDKEAFLNTFKNFVDEPFPACTIVEVSNLADNATVCIEGLGVNTLRHEEQMQQSSCSHDCSSCGGGCH